jgi:hypothetical protein
VKFPYISGPIAGAPELSHEEKVERFARAEEALHQRGMIATSPLRVEACLSEDCNGAETKEDGTYRHSWSCYLRYDLIEMLSECDSIALLPRWEASPGAVLENHVAEMLGWPVIDLTQDPIVLGAGQ